MHHDVRDNPVHDAAECARQYSALKGTTVTKLGVLDVMIGSTKQAAGGRKPADPGLMQGFACQAQAYDSMRNHVSMWH